MADKAEPLELIVVSDFVCPWCYLGLQEIEKIRREYDVELRFAPYLLDPSTPPEGKPRRPMTREGDAPTDMEKRAEGLGIKFSRGRTMTSNSLLAHQAAEYAAEHDFEPAFHQAMFKAYFTDLRDIGTIETVVDIGSSVGMDAGELRSALEAGTYRQQVEDGLDWAREIGVSGVPTFVFDGQYGVVGAQEYSVFENMMNRLAVPKRDSTAK